MRFSLGFRLKNHNALCVFWLRAETAEMRQMHTLQSLFKVFSRFALAPAPPEGSRQHVENELQKYHKQTKMFMIFSGPQGSASEVPLKMASGKLSGRLWDPPGRPSGPSNRSPFRPGGAPGRGHGVFRIPGPPPGPLRSAPGAHLGPSWRPAPEASSSSFWRPRW